MPEVASGREIHIVAQEILRAHRDLATTKPAQVETVT